MHFSPSLTVAVLAYTVAALSPNMDVANAALPAYVVVRHDLVWILCAHATSACCREQSSAAGLQMPCLHAGWPAGAAPGAAGMYCHSQPAVQHSSSEHTTLTLRCLCPPANQLQTLISFAGFTHTCLFPCPACCATNSFLLSHPLSVPPQTLLFFAGFLIRFDKIPNYWKW